ncbi:MAG: CPBP family intramembrane metalloprotease [Treponema sp.]|nr:CPBP family intramembrane metalloprotease [Treponema sp.]
MKKTYLILEFTVVFIFLVLPPLTAVSSPAYMDALASFHFPSVIKLFIALILFFQFRFLSGKRCEINNYRKIFYFMLSTGLLFLSLSASSALKFFLGETENLSPFKQTPLVIPGGLFIVFNFFCAAFYEEVLYRLFLPETLIMLIQENKAARVLFECSVIVLFAFSHKAAGISGVVHTFISASVLRFCTVKTGGILIPSAAHFLHNLSVLLFSAALS